MRVIEETTIKRPTKKLAEKKRDNRGRKRKIGYLGLLASEKDHSLSIHNFTQECLQRLGQRYSNFPTGSTPFEVGEFTEEGWHIPPSKYHLTTRFNYDDSFGMHEKVFKED